MLSLFIKQENGKTRVLEVDSDITGKELVSIIFDTLPNNYKHNCDQKKWLSLVRYSCGVKDIYQDKSLADLGVTNDSTIYETARVLSNP